MAFKAERFDEIAKIEEKIRDEESKRRATNEHRKEERERKLIEFEEEAPEKLQTIEEEIRELMEIENAEELDEVTA